MKREVVEHFCDKCGKKIDRPMPDTTYDEVPDGDYAYIGVKAMFSNCGVGDKYDLCRDCTIEIVEQWLEKVKRGE